jgi:ArsR family transcriptional regulator
VVLSPEQQQKMLKNAAAAEGLLKLLANKYRLQILCSLTDTPKSVGELETLCGLSQSALSQHLAKLRQAEVVSTIKEGQMVYYKLASMELNALLSVLHLIYCKE